MSTHVTAVPGEDSGNDDAEALKTRSEAAPTEAAPIEAARTEATEPEPVGARWILSLSLAMLGLWIAVLSPFQVLLPRQIEAVARLAGDPGSKNTLLAWVTALSAVGAIISCPLAGALSDRTTSRFGRRRPWAAGGAALTAAALSALAVQTTFTGIVISWMLVQVGINAMYAALSATIADQVPVRQRGVVSALVGLPIPIGLITGTFLTSMVVHGTASGYLTLAGILLVLQIPFLLWAHDPVSAARAPLGWRDFWVSPREHPDFAWVGSGRFAIQLGNGVGTLYLYYYIQDVLHRPDPEQSVLTIIIVYTLAAMSISVGVGRWSDVINRRKPFVVASTALMASAVLVFALGENWTAALLAGAVLGLGYGSFLAIDNALITQVLPAAHDRAKDLGVINVANTAPQVLAPAIAGPIVASAGYEGLYGVTAAILILGAILIQPVRSVR